jgi:hypothetical protein
MRKKGNLCEYIAASVDDQAITMKDPKELTDILEKHRKFKLKGTGTITPCVYRQLSTWINLLRTMKSHLA